MWSAEDFQTSLVVQDKKKKKKVLLQHFGAEYWMFFLTSCPEFS